MPRGLFKKFFLLDYVHKKIHYCSTKHTAERMKRQAPDREEYLQNTYLTKDWY